MAGKGLKRLLTRDRLTQGIEVGRRGDGLLLDLHVVVEYGLNLAEVAATVRSRVAYEVERLTGPPGRRGRGAHRRRAAVGVTELDRARELARAALADARGEPPPDRRPQRLSRAGRGHRHEPDAHRPCHRRGARGLDRDRPRGAREGAHARGADGGARATRASSSRRSSAARPRCSARKARSTRRRIARAFRGASDAAYRAVRQAGRGDDADGDPRAGGGGRGPAARDARTTIELFRALVERGEDALARTPEQLAVLREAGVVDAGGAGLLEIVRGLAAALAGEPAPEAPVEHAHEAGVDAIHQELSRVPLLHGVRGRGRGARRRRARARAGAARRLAARRRRLDRAQGARAHRRSRRRARARHRGGGRRGGRDRQHAQADGAARGAAARGGARTSGTRSRPASSRSCRAAATAASSRATARRA